MLVFTDLTPEIVDDFFDDDIDAMNTVATFSENRRRQSRRLDQKCDRDNIFRDQNQLRRDRNDRDVRQFTKNPREQNRSDQYEMKRKNEYKIHDLSFQVDSDKVVHDTSVRPRKSEPNSRRYTQVKDLTSYLRLPKNKLDSFAMHVCNVVEWLIAPSW